MDFEQIVRKFLPADNNGLTYTVEQNPFAIHRFYTDYNETDEFSYTPNRKETKISLMSPDAAYIGVRNNKNELVGICQCEKISTPSPFFDKPSFEKDGTFYGVSRALIKKEYRDTEIADTLLNIAMSSAKEAGATGIYTYTDYRNTDSINVLNKNMSWLGFIDGTKGAKDEQTIYLTFYKSFHNAPDGKFTKLIIHNELPSEKTISEIASSIGNNPLTCKQIPYGDGFHKLHFFADELPFRRIQYINAINNQNER